MTGDRFAAHPALAGLFVVWDTPAIKAAATLQALGQSLPIATIDPGREAAISLADGKPIIMVAAEQPYQQGVAVTSTAVLALLGQVTPAWVALRGWR